MEDFNIELLRFLNKTKKFKEIKDLSPLHQCYKILYLMLDEYSQVYIGGETIYIFLKPLKHHIPSIFTNNTIYF